MFTIDDAVAVETKRPGTHRPTRYALITIRRTRRFIARDSEADSGRKMAERLAARTA
jgi:hypothetical protein